MENKITIELTPAEALILFDAVCLGMKTEDFISSEASNAVLHKVDAAFQRAEGEFEIDPQGWEKCDHCRGVCSEACGKCRGLGLQLKKASGE